MLFKYYLFQFFYLRNNPIKDIPIFLKENSKFKRVFSTKPFFSLENSKISN